MTKSFRRTVIVVQGHSIIHLNGQTVRKVPIDVPIGETVLVLPGVYTLPMRPWPGRAWEKSVASRMLLIETEARSSITGIRHLDRFMGALCARYQRHLL